MAKSKTPSRKAKNPIDSVKDFHNLRLLSFAVKVINESCVDTLSRTIHIGAEISQDSFRRFCNRMQILESLSDEPINLEASCFGGDPEFAGAYVSRMHASPCIVNTTVHGLCASAAVIIFAAATGTRSMGELASIMHHEASYDINDIGHQKLMHMTKRWTANEMLFCRILARFTKMPATWWNAKSKSQLDLYISAQEAIEIGLADVIIPLKAPAKND